MQDGRFRALAAVAALALAGCLGAADDAPADGPASTGPERTDAADVDALAHNFTGTITGTPATPGEEDFTFDVPKGATEVAATLRWDGSPAASLQVALLDPRGDAQGRGFPEKPGQASVATVDPPRSGEWIARVTSTRAIDQAFTLEVRVSFLVPLDNVLADTVQMAAGDFVELNLIMEGGASFRWEFQADGGEVDWNVHSHENSRTQYHEEGKGTSHEGNFTAPKRQIYSIMWESLSPQPIDLSYRVEGAFRVHSHSQ